MTITGTRTLIHPAQWGAGPHSGSLGFASVPDTGPARGADITGTVEDDQASAEARRSRHRPDADLRPAQRFNGLEGG